MKRNICRWLALLLCLTLCLGLCPPAYAGEIVACDEETAIQEVTGDDAAAPQSAEESEPETPQSAEAPEQPTAEPDPVPVTQELPAAASDGEPDTGDGEPELLPDPVDVRFYMPDEELLAFLSVTDADGMTIDPVADPDSGVALFGSYLLMPGEYVYHFRDESGEYADLEEPFVVEEEYVCQFISVEPEMLFEEYTFSFVYIDPIFEGILTPEDIPQSPYSDEERLDDVRELAAVMEGGSRGDKERYLRNDTAVYETPEDAALALRQQVKDFEQTATIRLVLIGEQTQENLDRLCAQVAQLAMAHTGVPTEGDYLRYEHGGYSGNGAIVSKGGRIFCRFDYTMVHFTNAEQEAVVDQTVANILESLSLDGKTDYQKAFLIYQYLTSHVSFGGTGNLKFTAYGALVDGAAQCQGYAASFYRLCLEAHVDTRVITCSDMGHAWNIVKVGDSYYELDATWDTGRAPQNYLYFLRGSEYWLARHKNSGGSSIGDQYKDSAFASQYPLPAFDYKATLTAQPENVTIFAGRTAEFSVQAVGGELHYSWQTRTGTEGEWETVPGAQTGTLTLTPTLEDSGRLYRCEVSNGAGPVYSGEAALTVNNYTYTATLNLADSIGVNFIIKGADNYDGLTITWEKKDKTVVTQNVTDGIPTGSGGYFFALESLAAKEMAVPIPVTVKDANGNILKQTACSVKSYCQTAEESPKASESLKNLCRAALVYGSAAQTRFSFETMNLADPDYREKLPASVPDDADTASSCSEPAAGITNFGVALNLISQTEMNVYLAHGEGSLSDYQFSVKKGSETYTNFRTAEVGDAYVVVVQGLAALDLLTPFTIEVSRGGETYTVNLTPLAYAYKMQGDDINGEVSRGIYHYAMAAKDYR